jgi:hypothetical protein
VSLATRRRRRHILAAAAGASERSVRRPIFASLSGSLSRPEDHARPALCFVGACAVCVCHTPIMQQRAREANTTSRRPARNEGAQESRGAGCARCESVSAGRRRRHVCRATCGSNITRACVSCLRTSRGTGKLLKRRGRRRRREKREMEKRASTTAAGETLAGRFAQCRAKRRRRRRARAIGSSGLKLFLASRLRRSRL